MILRGTTRLLGLLGHPLAHSHSPAMHNAAIEGLGLDLAYVPLPVEAAGLKTCLDAMRLLNFLGANVTMPHKEAVIPYLDDISEISALMGAANTLTFRDGKIHGTTTDPEGFLAGFRAAGHSFAGKSVAILGNGGTARTAAFALFHLDSPRRVAVAARDTAKSKLLAAEIRSQLKRDLDLLSLSEYPDHAGEFEVVVNATPVGLHPKVGESLLAPESLRPGQILYDLIYNPEETTLMRYARGRGCGVVGGLGMLVHQGIASFKLWTGIDPDRAFFYEGIRRSVATAGKS